MPEYSVVTSVSCGKIYKLGEIIPNGVLSDRDAKQLIKLGAIALLVEVIEEKKETAPQVQTFVNKPQVKSGAIALSDEILDYVNNSDREGLERIKGVGNATAKAMANHGKFASIEELKELVNNVDWETIEIV